MEEIDHYQSDEGNFPNETNPRPYQSFTNARTSTSGTHFVCSNQVSRILIKRLKYLTHRFYLPVPIIKPSPNDRLHIPPPRMAAFSEAIIQGGASHSLHPFIFEVLDYFNIAPFQFTSNSINTMVAFYITFIEADIGEPLVVEFAYVHCIKALARNKGFWHTNKWGLDVERVQGTHNNIDNYKDRYFFYPSDRPWKIQGGQ